MRPVPQVGLDLIRRSESLRLAPYLDSAGIPTIGWGAIRGPTGARVTMADPPITAEQAEAMLERDIARDCGRVEPLCPVSLTDGQYAALCDFAFNLGAGALQRASFRQALLRRDYAAVPVGLRKYVFAGGIKTAGLVYRREREAQLWAS